eukprot:TRINITY_DN8818_c0_g1_i3.p1 TRINITY_DN8818_c0_g1~~TRINITY_DN8818_c0_g1_i3.p1  ORF type:complete len:656 (+),score=145.29 TRINITY_DN8818_c0_g1_i3:111-2078(+)
MSFFFFFKQKTAYEMLRSLVGSEMCIRDRYQSPAEENFLSEYDTWVLYMVGALAIVFVLLWIFAALRFTKQGKRVVRPIFKTEFKGVVKVIRWIMRGASVLFMLASVGVMGIAVYYYINASAIGKIIIILGIALAVGLYIMAFVGFWAVAHRAKKLVILNTVVLSFGLLVLGGLCAIVITVGRDIQEDDSFWTVQLRTLWESLVADSPDHACAIQGMLSCSGFYIPCNNVIGSTLYCPTNCESINQKFGFPCKERLQQYIADGYAYLLGVLIGSMALMVFAIIFNCIYHYKLVQMKRSIRDRTNTKIYNRASAKKMVNSDNIGRAKALHILKTLDDDAIPKLVKEFHRMDMDGDGEVDRTEMAHFFRKALCHHITEEELDALFEVADLDGNGTISLDEFLVIFNKKKPKEVKQYSWEKDAVPGLKTVKSGMGSIIKTLNPNRNSSDWREDPIMVPSAREGDDDNAVELKTEEQLEKEVLLRQRAKEHLGRCGLYDQEDEVAEQSAMEALEMSRRRSSANFSVLTSTPSNSKTAGATSSTTKKEAKEKAPTRQSFSEIPMVMEEGSFNDSILAPHGGKDRNPSDPPAVAAKKKKSEEKKKKASGGRKASVETLDLPSPTTESPTEGGSMSPLEGSMKRSFKRRQSTDAGSKNFADI